MTTATAGPYFPALGTALIAGLLLSLAATGLVRRYAIARLLDTPNERSSHNRPTPRGGGLGFVLIILAALPMAAWLGLVPARTAIALFGASAMVAAIGFLDDHRHVPAHWRLLIHGAAAAWGLFWLGGLPALEVGDAFTLPHWLINSLAWLSLVWLLNLYNFMDGIDGLAATEGCCVLGGGILLALLTGAPAGFAALLALALGAVAGFLCWNRPPARIFMGDVGSGFLGLILGLLAINAARHHTPVLASWVIMLALFVTDASWTLMRRLCRGDRIHQAHRSHGYQRLARRLGSHAKVTLGAAAINVLWLLPWAVAVAQGTVGLVCGSIVSILPLVVIVALSGAGNSGETTAQTSRL